MIGYELFRNFVIKYIYNISTQTNNKRRSMIFVHRSSLKSLRKE